MRGFTDDMKSFFRQLADAVKAGTPLVSALDVIHDSWQGEPLKKVLGVIARDIKSGDSFAVALAKQSLSFPPWCVELVKSGEVGGVLDIALSQLADLLEKPSKNELATSFRVLSVLLRFNVRIFRAYGLMEGNCEEKRHAYMWRAVHQWEHEGNKPCDALSWFAFVPADVIAMIRNAECRETKAETFAKVADWLDENS